MQLYNEFHQLQDSQLPSNRHTMPPYSVTNVGGSGIAALSDLSRKKFALSTGSAESKDAEQVMREYRAQLEDLRTRLRLVICTFLFGNTENLRYRRTGCGFIGILGRVSCRNALIKILTKCKEAYSYSQNSIITNYFIMQV